MQTPRVSIYHILADRLRKSEEAFKEYARRLCTVDYVVEAYLVGSRARGDHLPYSDYDVVAVVKPDKDKLEAIEELRRLKPRPLPLDLIVLHPNDLEDPIYKPMLKDSRKLC